jgi:hypothetical protein
MKSIQKIFIILLGVITFQQACFSMKKDGNPEWTDDERVGFFEENVSRDHSWSCAGMNMKQYPHLREQFEAILLNANISSLNSDRYGWSLIEELL